MLARLIILAAGCVAAFAVRAAVLSGPPAELAIGSRAAAAGDFDAAWRAYSTLKARAELEDNPAWREEALKGMLDCALQSRSAERFAILAALYGQEDGTGRFVRGMQALLEGRPVDAETLFDGLLDSGAVLPGAWYFNLLDEAGKIKLALKKYEEAGELYLLMQRAGEGGFWAQEGLKRRIYALIKAGRAEQALESVDEALKSVPAPSPELAGRLAMLRLLALVSGEDLEEFEEDYAELPAVGSGEFDDLRYEAAVLAAEHHLKNRRPSAAVKYWRDAFASASNTAWQQEAAQRLFNSLIAAGELDEALKVLDKYLELYPETESAGEMRLARPRLLMSLNREAEALADYEVLIADASPEGPVWRPAVLEAARVYRTARRDADVMRVLQLLKKHAANADQRREADFLLAEQHYAMQRYREAAKAFQALAGTENPYRQEARYWAVRAFNELKEWQPALELARALWNDEAASAEQRAAGGYYTGFLQERLGDPQAALRAYDRCAADFPVSGYAAAARFQAARLAWELERYGDAADWFTQAAALITDPEVAGASDVAPDGKEAAAMAAEALSRAVQAACYADRPEAMDALLQRLKEEFPESEYTAAALFWHIDYLKGVGREADAEAALQEMADFYRDGGAADRLPAVWYDQAQLLSAGAPAEAIAVAARLIGEYPDHPLAAEAWFLTGDLYSRDGRFAEAREAYQGAFDARPEGDFGRAARGRIADCSIQLHAQTRKEEELTQAREIYRELLESPDLPQAMRAQTLYKYGKSCETAGDAEAALAAYNSLIYGAAEQLTVDGHIAGEAWVARGGYAAIKLCLNMNRPEKAREALALIRTFKSLNLPTGEDFRSLERAVYERFRI